MWACVYACVYIDTNTSGSKQNIHVCVCVCVCTFVYVYIKVINLYSLTSVEIRYSLAFRCDIYETVCLGVFLCNHEWIKSVYSNTVLAFPDLSFLTS